MCKCHGLLTYNIEDYRFGKEKFCNFLDNLSDKVQGKKVYMFIDNCTIHHSQLARDKMKEKNIIPIWNVFYRFEFNEAIEKYWAMLKAHFRPLLLNMMLKNPGPKDKPLNEALRQSIEKVSRDSIPTFIDRGLKFLKEEAEEINRQRLEKHADK